MCVRCSRSEATKTRHCRGGAARASARGETKAASAPPAACSPSAATAGSFKRCLSLPSPLEKYSEEEFSCRGMMSVLASPRPGYEVRSARKQTTLATFVPRPLPTCTPLPGARSSTAMCINLRDLTAFPPASPSRGLLKSTARGRGSNSGTLEGARRRSGNGKEVLGGA